MLQSDWKESGVPFYRAREIVKLSENGFVNNELFISENLYDELAKSGIPQAGDIMLSAVGTLGATYIVKPTDKFYYKDASVICLSKISDLQPKFLCYLFDSNIILHQIDRQAKGATVGTITISNASKFKVPVPDYKVQEQIVAELDKINETIEDCRELLRNLDALAQSLFYDYFGDPNTNPKGWDISTFGNIGTFTRGGGFLKRDFVDNGIPCIHYGQIHTKFNNIVRYNLTYISDSTALKSKFAKPNDVIFAITSEDLEGSCKTIAWLGDKDVAVGGHAAIFSHSQNPVFITYYTRSNAFAIEKEKYAHGSKVVEIRPADIANIPIYIPPLELQEKFAARIEQIEEQKKSVEQTIAELQTLLDSRMDYWFN